MVVHATFIDERLLPQAFPGNFGIGEFRVFPHDASGGSHHQVLLWFLELGFAKGFTGWFSG